MEQTTLALFAKLFISIGCQNADLTYRPACTTGGKQVIERSQIGKLAETKEEQIKVRAEDFANAYIFPFLGKQEFVIAVASIDALAKREISYGFKSDMADQTLIKFSQETAAIQLTWEMK